MGNVVMHNVVSVDGFIADENDQVGPLFDWYVNGEYGLAEDRQDATGLGLEGVERLRLGSVATQHLLEDPNVVIRGDRVLHLRYRVRR